MGIGEQVQTTADNCYPGLADKFFGETNLELYLDFGFKKENSLVVF